MHPELLKYLSKFPMLDETEQLLIAEQIPVCEYEKGAILLREGQIANKCFFVLKGCIRQYSLLDGEEKTTAFFTEEQAAVSFTSYAQQIPCEHYLICAEDSILIVGYLDKEQDMYQKFPKLETITRTMMAQDFGKTQEEFAKFMTSSPEERYLNLLKTRPELLNRVPQHQLASYLGISPESLSRIRKRIAQKK